MGYTISEKVVQRVIMKYLEERGQRSSSGGAGPDIKIGHGKGVEVKGGKLTGERFERAIKQISEYTHDWSDIELAFPITALTMRKLYSLHVIEESLRFRELGKNKTIPVYLVSKINDNEYSVLRFNSMKDLFEDVTKAAIQKFTPKYGEGKIKQTERIARVYSIDEVIIEILEERANSTQGRKVQL